jgi:integrase
MAIKKYLEDEKKLYEVYINGFDSAGRRIQRRKTGIETLRKAEHIEFELKRELAKLKEEAVPYRWGEWFNKCVQTMKLVHQPSTIWNYTSRLGKWVNPHWENREINSILKTEVYKLIFETIDPKLSLHSRKTILKMVRRIFEMAMEEGVLIKNPCMGIQVRVPEVEQKVLTNTEVGIFLKEAKLTQHRCYPMWVSALSTGMRSGELFALKWTDLDFEGKTIAVTKQWTSRNGFCPTKTQKNRVVPISEDYLKFLKELKLKCDPNAEFVLPRMIEWENGEQAKITREFCVAIGITPIKFHDLRATFITNLLARGESLARVMAVVGHTQIKTTNGYLRRAGVDVKGVTDSLGFSIPEDSLGSVISIASKFGR